MPEEVEQYAISEGPFTFHVTRTLTDPTRPDGAVVWEDDVVLEGPQPLATTIDYLPTGAGCVVEEADPGAATGCSPPCGSAWRCCCSALRRSSTPAAARRSRR